MIGRFTRTYEVQALQVTPETPPEEIAEFAPAFRVSAWMPRQRGWLVRRGRASVRWVHPADFVCEFEPVGAESEFHPEVGQSDAGTEKSPEAGAEREGKNDDNE